MATSRRALWRMHRRKIPYRFEECEYTPVRNPDASDGLWVIGKRRQTVYARKELSLRDQIAAGAAKTLPPLPGPGSPPMPPLPSPAPSPGR
jgi:hypothetical protein